MIDMQAKQQQFVELLLKWNKAYNLTAITDPLEIQTRHINDSLSLLSWIQGSRILDLGTGAGLPGIPLAIVMPERQFTLLDSNNKKTRFVTQAVIELGLKNVEVVTSRAEQFRPSMLFDQILSRAVAKSADLVNSSAHLLKPGGQWLIMKGQDPAQELQALARPAKVISLHVDGLQAERHCVLVNKDT